MEVEKRFFANANDGTHVNTFIFRNDKEMEIEIIEFGTIVRCLRVSDISGIIKDVVMGFDSLKE